MSQPWLFLCWSKEELMQGVVHSMLAPWDFIIASRSTRTWTTRGGLCLFTWQCEWWIFRPTSVPLNASSIIEMTAGMAVLCMPAIAAIFKYYRPVMKAFFGQRQNENNDTEQGTFYQMTKLRNVVTHPNNQEDVEALSSNRHGHRATSSSDSAMKIRIDTSDSVS